MEFPLSLSFVWSNRHATASSAHRWLPSRLKSGSTVSGDVGWICERTTQLHNQAKSSQRRASHVVLVLSTESEAKPCIGLEDLRFSLRFGRSRKLDLAPFRSPFQPIAPTVGPSSSSSRHAEASYCLQGSSYCVFRSFVRLIIASCYLCVVCVWLIGYQARFHGGGIACSTLST